MRRFSSAMRFVFKRLLEGKKDGDIIRSIYPLFGLNYIYAHGALPQAKAIISSRKELGRSPANLVFGGKKLFEELSKKHISGKRREELLKKWRERRQGMLFAVGKKHSKGNGNLGLVWADGRLFLRITVEEKHWVHGEAKE
jgi:predicted transposase